MKTAIIGGGVGGLMSALYLSKQGIEVSIYEKEDRLGGRLAFIEKDGFRIDRGPTIVLLPDMLQQLLDEAGIDRSTYELIPCDPLYSLHFPDGTVYTKHRDIQKQEEELMSVFPSEVEGFRRFMKEGRTRFHIGKNNFLERSFVQSKDFWTPRNLTKLMKLKPYLSVQKLMANYFQDERLQASYALQSLYIGGNPFQSPAMYSLISFAEHEYGIYYLKGGYASLVEVLKKELLKRGVTIHLNREVEKIHHDNDRVTALETKSGIAEYDAVVFNGDFPHLAEMVDQKEKRNFTPSSGCVLLYFGLNKIYDNALIHQYFMGQNFSEHMKDVFERRTVPTDPAFYTFHPSVVDESLAPAGKGVLYTLIPVPSDTEIDWRNEKEWIASILDRMEATSFPGLRKAIEWMEIRTPEDDREFGLYKGGSFGIAPILFQSGVFRPQVKPYSFENLYSVGASIHPGGGIPLVMQGSKLLADQVMSDDLIKGVKIHV